MDKKQLIKKIIQKKEFSELPAKDVELAFEKFDKERYLDEEKIKFTRDLLRKVFSAFTSQKLLSLKDKDSEWILRKHLSTRERLPYYEELYRRLLKGFGKKLSVIDLGSGINGFSHKYFGKIGKEVDYLAIEAVGQLVKLMNYYFKTSKLKGEAIHLSLFDLKIVKKIIGKAKNPRVIFLFKTIDSLEMLEKDYSKIFLEEIVPLGERFVVSFATRSMIKKTKFKAKRNWIVDFIGNNFVILDDFEIGCERYVVFCRKKKHL